MSQRLGLFCRSLLHRHLFALHSHARHPALLLGHPHIYMYSQYWRPLSLSLRPPPPPLNSHTRRWSIGWCCRGRGTGWGGAETRANLPFCAYQQASRPPRLVQGLFDLNQLLYALAQFCVGRCGRQGCAAAKPLAALGGKFVWRWRGNFP